MMRTYHRKADQVAGGVFLVGLAILFMSGDWWPGILFVLGATAIARGMAEGRPWYSTGGMWMLALGLVFWLGFSLPALLALIGLSMIFGHRYGWGMCSGLYDGQDKRKNEEKRKNDEVYRDAEYYRL